MIGPKKKKQVEYEQTIIWKPIIHNSITTKSRF